MPRDPEGTLERVTGDRMRVGITDSRPWTRLDGGEPGGLEAGLLRQFADELGTRIEWAPGSEADLLKALESFELDVVIAGLTTETPWRARIGLSRPYATTKTVVGAAPGALGSQDLSGLRVAVRRGEPAAATLRSRSAEPLVVTDLPAAQGLAVVEDWELEDLGLTATGIVLAAHEHVMAVPPGENALLLRLDRFLASRQADVQRALRGEGRT